MNSKSYFNIHVEMRVRPSPRISRNTIFDAKNIDMISSYNLGLGNGMRHCGHVYGLVYTIHIPSGNYLIAPTGMSYPSTLIDHLRSESVLTTSLQPVPIPSFSCSSDLTVIACARVCYPPLTTHHQLSS
jgi:hypothetical protein